MSEKQGPKPWPGLTDEERVAHLFPPNPGGEHRPVEVKPPRWTVSTFLIRDGFVLLIRHKGLDMWLPIGGGIEEGERPAEAVLREVREETGFRIDEIEHVMFEEHWTGKRLHMNHAYRARVFSHGDPVSDGSWDSHVWLRLGDAPPEGTPENVRRILHVLVPRGPDAWDALVQIRSLVDRSSLMSRERIMRELMSILDSTDDGCIGARRRTSAQVKSEALIIPEIVDWLLGLEGALERVIRSEVPASASERREMTARRGVYEGIADDIKRKWGAR